MTELGRIVLADDEETFARATAELLRREGYACDVAGDGAAAQQLLSAAHYDILIADICMPGNPALELIESVRRSRPEMPAILVTGYPSLHTAISAINLSVTAYLVKPFDFPELLEAIRASIESSRTGAVVQALRNNIERIEGGNGEHVTEAEVVGDRPVPSVGEFIDASAARIVEQVRELAELSRRLARAHGAVTGDALEPCPSCARLSDALRAAIESLRRTKSAFKSKELGTLRRNLEQVLADMEPHRRLN